MLLNTYCCLFIFQPTSRFQISLSPFSTQADFFTARIFIAYFQNTPIHSLSKNRMATLLNSHFPVPSFSSTGIFQYRHFPVPSFSSTGICSTGIFQYWHFQYPFYTSELEAECFYEELNEAKDEKEAAVQKIEESRSTLKNMRSQVSENS